MTDSWIADLVCTSGDLTAEAADAVVNAAKPSLRGGSGVDGAIHRAAGPGLLAECIERYPLGCAKGEARITGAHDLPSRFVIHSPGPIYGRAHGREAELLASCHRESLRLAVEHDCASIAFPAISCGIYGYPPEEASRVAIRACVEFLRAERSRMHVRFVLFGEEMLRVWREARAELLD